MERYLRLSRVRGSEVLFFFGADLLQLPPHSINQRSCDRPLRQSTAVQQIESIETVLGTQYPRSWPTTIGEAMVLAEISTIESDVLEVRSRNRALDEKY